jgi:hypothetical protein
MNITKHGNPTQVRGTKTFGFWTFLHAIRPAASRSIVAVLMAQRTAAQSEEMPNTLHVGHNGLAPKTA